MTRSPMAVLAAAVALMAVAAVCLHLRGLTSAKEDASWTSYALFPVWVAGGVPCERGVAPRARAART